MTFIIITDLMKLDDHPCPQPPEFLILQSFPPQQLASSGLLYHDKQAQVKITVRKSHIW